VIRAYIDNGWIFYGEVTVNKDPQAQAIRTKSHALMFVTKNRDSAGTRPALADYLLIFRKPGDNAVRIEQTDGHWSRVSNEEWIDWAQPVWWDIKETNTLNVRVAREEADERHICPLQLDFIERCVRLWSNPGETVLSPFAGIGSEVYVARKLDRYGLGCELKPSYWRTAVDNLTTLETELSHETLFDGALA
jgi:DNA modification methylase